MSMGLWSGKLKHRMATAGGYSTVDLLNLTALIPDRCAASHSLHPSLRPASGISVLQRCKTHLRLLQRTAC